jgi:hypothetical protein
MAMNNDIFRDRRVAERRYADDVSAEVICRRIHQERRRYYLLKDAWQWWLRVNYVDDEYSYRQKRDF